SKPMLPTEKALGYFDTYFKPVYGDLWPSIRVSLLSGQKYGAVLNNYCQNETENFLKDLGAKNMIEIAQNAKSGWNTSDVDSVNKDGEKLDLPENLKVFTYKPGNISDFPPPKPDKSKLLGYYLLDASSILPVISLNIKPGEKVLDLCAAPGGKTLTMLQSLIPVYITSNDISASRIARLKTILKYYVPLSHQYVDTSCVDARQLSLPHSFDKVLVDVPCNCDRVSLLSDSNNIFSPVREDKRLKMSALQKDILVSGIKHCKPGGSIVYSTCTLSPPQNDGVIQAALEQIWQNTPIDVSVEDISIITQQFKDTFTFFHNCRHGQLVIPSLTKNFGPMYIAKLNRIK
ncbi:hypothetical protein LOTGIDRAFT_131154, partial [Lottia gigantea]